MAFGDVGERPLFELQFNIFYTKYDFVTFSIFTYLVPKTDEDVKMLHSPRDASEFEFEKSIFIGKLTSNLLYENAKKALMSNYKAKSWM